MLVLKCAYQVVHLRSLQKSCPSIAGAGSGTDGQLTLTWSPLSFRASQNLLQLPVLISRSSSSSELVASSLQTK